MANPHGLRAANIIWNAGPAKILASASGQAPAGQLTALIGPNGAGKTTLLRIMAGLLAADQGQVDWQGRPLADLAAAELATTIAWVPSSTDLPFAMSVREVVALGRYPWRRQSNRLADQEAIEQALADLQITKLAERSYGVLSAGERRKTMLARALVQDTPLIILDEPCANLDPGAAQQIVAHLRELADAGKTILVSLHDLGLVARFAHHCLAMHAGELIAEGDPCTVLTPPVIKQLYQLDAEWVTTSVGPQLVLS